MYKLSCDGYPLLDWRDNNLILANPKVKLEVNTVGECSFTIYEEHPYYHQMKKLKSIFEVTDEFGVIFRGRMTGNTMDFDNGKAVDLEGVMAFFNDSIIRPFNFPEDFLENADYVAAAKSGNVVLFFLNWLIEQHNSQVQDFQKLHLGNVTVADPNNYITRSNSEYDSTWATLKSKLFDSSLGGYLCARYEKDGTYIDYLQKLDEINNQKITYGENLLDLINEEDANETYSAIIPKGKDGLTIKNIADGTIKNGVVKKGDTLYLPSAVESYGWIYAPVKETTWDDVTVAQNLLDKGAEWLTQQGIKLANTIEVTAVDLHFTDEQIRSFRIYKGIQVSSTVHGLEEIYPLTRLDIDLLNPQNTKITVGNTQLTLTDKQNADAANNSQKIHTTIVDLEDKVNTLQNKVEGVEGLYFYIKYSPYADGHVMTDVPNENTMYMGTCSTQEETAPTDSTKYTWCRVKGTQGESGVDGKDGIDGKDGADAILCRIDSSGGYTLKESDSVTLTARVFTGTEEIDPDGAYQYTWFRRIDGSGYAIVGYGKTIAVNENDFTENADFYFVCNETHLLVDYIETTGEQYIDTGFIPNQDSRFVGELMMVSISGNQSVYGSRQNANSADNASRNFAFRVIGGKWQPCYGKYLRSTGIPADTKNWHIIDQNKNVCYIHGIESYNEDELTEGTTVVDGVAIKVIEEQTFTSPSSLLIGAIRSGASGTSTYYTKARFRSCKIYDNGVLVRDMVACINANGEAGMYDYVNEVFYGNAGTGTFVLPEVEVSA